MVKEYPEIDKLRLYADEIKRQIENILSGEFGFRGITGKLEALKKEATPEIAEIASKLAKHATEIVAPKRNDNGEPAEVGDRTDMLALRKLANGLKLAQVLKVHEQNATYRLYRVNDLGNLRKK